MARKVIWSDDAIADLAARVEHIAEDNLSVAERTGRAILEQARLLEVFPLSGRIVPEVHHPSVREVQHPPWRIIYELPDDGAVVFCVRGMEPRGDRTSEMLVWPLPFAHRRCFWAALARQEVSRLHDIDGLRKTGGKNSPATFNCHTIAGESACGNNQSV